MGCLQRADTNGATCRRVAIEGTLIGMSASELPANDAPEHRPSVMWTDRIFELAQTVTDDYGLKPYPTLTRVRSVFNINPTTLSQWRTEKLPPEQLLNFTVKLIEIFSGKYQKHVDEGGLEDANLIYCFWQSKCADPLKRAINALERYEEIVGKRNAANAQARILAQLEAESSEVAVRGSSVGPLGTMLASEAVDKLLAARGHRLRIDAEELIPPETRKNLFLRRPTWDLVCRGAYARREEVLSRQVNRFIEFFSKRQTEIDQLKLPIFWIGGRSGDGKSVLLLQLLREILDQPAPPTIFWCRSPDDLIALMGDLPDRVSNQMILAVDDLHKVVDWDAASITIEQAANKQNDVVVLTCGPAPERSAFLRDKHNLIALCPSDAAPSLTEADAASLTKHLGIEVHAASEKRPTLVEQLYFGLGGEHDLAAFAKSLQNRVDLPSGQKGLLSELTALTWMDVPYPANLLDPVALARIIALADETQLHFEEVPGGFRFGHPAIAKKMFDALTADPPANTPLAPRLAALMSPVLRKMDVGDRRRALRQIGPRLARDADLTTFDVLTMLYRTAGGPALAADIAVLLLSQDTLSGKDGERLKWVRTAQTFRDNTSIDPRVRANFTERLALVDPPDEKDLRAAFKLAADPKVAPYIGQTMSRLLSRKGKVALRTLPYALDWAEKNINSTARNDVIVSLLAAHPNDIRVRQIARKLIDTTDAKKLGPPIIGSLAKYMEEDSEELVKRWLVAHQRSIPAGDVLTTLLARPGLLWIDTAIGWLGTSARLEGGWANVAGRVLQHIEPNHPLVAKSKDWALAVLENEESGELFESLAQRATEFDALDIVEHRLLQRWGFPDALKVFTKVWPHIETPTEVVLNRLRDVIDWAKAGNDDSRGNIIKGNAAAEVLGALVLGNHNATYWLHHCIDYLHSKPDSAISGAIVGRLLSILAASKVVASEPEKILKDAEGFLLELAWEHVSGSTKYKDFDRAGALAGLIRLRWNIETPRIREAIRDYFYPNPRRAGSYVLGAWLAQDDARSEAFRFLIDRSIDTDRLIAVRASAAAWNLSLMFEWIKFHLDSNLDKEELCRLLEYGVGDFQRNPVAAWHAWQKINSWPDQAVPSLWRGVLRSSIEGFSMRRDIYWTEFEGWFKKSRDSRCANIIQSAGL